jgi:threonine synthase
MSRNQASDPSAMNIICTNCGRPYPAEGLPYRCVTCGGLYDYSSPLTFDPEEVDLSQPGVWRYRHTFGIPADTEAVTLGEGGTPLLWIEAYGRNLAFKCEYLNPSGSFKDRGSAILAGMLRARGVSQAVEDSSGNAGASFAAYAARAGIRARIFVPESASGPKRKQIEAYGAELVPIPGSRSDVTEAVTKAIGGEVAYASHALLPFNLSGYATAAYEICEQLDRRAPGAVIIPAGQGGLLLGIYRGFEALRLAGVVSSIPKMVGVQARACAPLWAMYTGGREALGFVAENRTIAEGVRVRFPLRGDAVLKALQSSQGSMLAVDEEDILPGRDALARLGLYVEPTSAIVWSALAQIVNDLPDPVVVVLTGTGYKYIK